ncbi:MAG: MotA/TolQ/ExbB proton channel family protein [Terracidiphilus sp.]
MISAFVIQLPPDSGAAQGTPLSLGSSALVEMVMNSGPVALFVLLLLLIASIYSWTVILGKISTFRKATRESQRFIHAFRTATRLQEMATMSAECKASPLAQVFDEVYETYKRQTGGSGPPRNLTPLERSAQTAASEAVTSLERRLTWMATIGAVSPFVGLFGTVIGIVDAFHGLGTAGAATLRAVAPGISEALITTAAGLFVAIPAVIAYNQFTARIRVFAAAIDDFCRELLNSLEEIPVRGSAGSARTANAEGGREPAREPVREVDRGLYK